MKWFLISPQYHLPVLIPAFYGELRGRLGRQDYIIFPFPEERKKVKSARGDFWKEGTCGHSLFYYFVVIFMLKDVKEESYIAWLHE